MIPTKNNPGLSNLSIVIPRSVHQAAKAKYLRSGAPSFATYIATLLEEAPETTSYGFMVRSYGMKVKLSVGKSRVRRQ